MTVVRHINHEVQDWDRLRHRLSRARIERGLSQEQIAERAGLAARSTLGRIERGESTPGIDTVISLARTVGLSVELVTPFQRRVMGLPPELVFQALRNVGLA